MCPGFRELARSCERNTSWCEVGVDMRRWIPFKRSETWNFLEAKQIRETRTAAPSTTQGSSGPSIEIAVSSTIRSSTVRFRPPRIGVRCHETGARNLTLGHQPASFVKPVAHEIGEGGDRFLVDLAHAVRVLIAQDAAHGLGPENGGLPITTSAVGQFRFGIVRGQDRIAVLDGVERLQDRVARSAKPLRRRIHWISPIQTETRANSAAEGLISIP